MGLFYVPGDTNFAIEGDGWGDYKKRKFYLSAGGTALDVSGLIIVIRIDKFSL